MTALAWLLAALAAAVWPAGGRQRGSRSARHGSERSVSSPLAAKGHETLLAPVAACAAAVVAVLEVGPPGGILAAAVVAPAVGLGVEVLRRRPRRARPDRDVALCLDLVAALLRSGHPLESALEHAAPAAGGSGPGLTRAARLLALGADPGEAWRACAPPGSLLEPVAAVAVRSRSSGLKLADAFERLAADLRAECSAAAAARAGRAGIQAMGPLAACFLPSFVCLGIVPLVVGVAAAATGTLR